MTTKMFQLELEMEIKYTYFFKGQNKEERISDEFMDADDFINKPKGLIKKNYIMVDINPDKNIMIKNLGIKKKSNSPLSRKIFWEYLVPEIKKGVIKFSKAHISNLMNKLLKEDFTFAAMRKEVGDFSQYEKKSPTSLPGQIANKYGAGIHFLIPNKKGLGVGKGKNFCTIEEFKEHKLKIEDIDLDNCWKELDYFIKPVVTRNIFDFEDK